MDPVGIIVLVGFVVAYALVSGRVDDGPLSPPMVFVGVGAVAGWVGWGDGLPVETLLPLLEVTLALILFSDAARIDVSLLRRRFRMPLRLLVIGLPLSIALGTVAGLLILPALGVAGALLVAVMLAPTDAAVGEPVVTNPLVPEHVRQAINVESGLNDGLAVPALAAAVAFAGMSGGGEGAIELVLRSLGQIVLGVGIGGLAGLIGAAGLKWATDRRWAERRYRKIGTAALALLAFLLADMVGASGFVAAFVAGGVLGHRARELCSELLEFADTEGRLLSLISFFMFGAVAVPAAVAALDLRTVLYAIASLTAVRMVPVAIALAGRRYDPSTVLYIGWFGPRGIASIVFAFLAAEQLGDVDQVVTVVSVAVVASLLLHGLSAGPLSARYGNAALAMDAGRPERDDAGAARVWSSKDSAV